MKKVVFTFLMVLLSSVFYGQQFIVRYENFRKGNSFVNVFIAKEKYWGSKSNLKKTRVFEGQYEYFIKTGKSIGGFLSYSKSKFDSNIQGYKSEYSDYTFGVMYNRHLFFYLDRFFVYVGAKAGYKKASINTNIPNYIDNQDTNTTYSGAIGGLHLGTRIFLSLKTSVQMELGGYYAFDSPKSLGGITGVGRIGLSYNF